MPKTNITPKNLFEQRNTSDVFSRLVVMGILRILNQQLSYTQVWDDSEDGVQNVTVPFFFDFGGGSVTSERFIQDNYLNWTDDECTQIGMKKMNGDYKPIPFGVITLDSTNIDQSNISNRFVMGKFQKRVNGELKSYVSFLYSIPLSINFTVNIVCDTVNTMWKIEQAYREYFYKNKTFRFNYRGTVCPARVGFPETITENKTMQYQMGNTTGDGYDIKLSFNLQCETYQPVFDKYSEQPADNVIRGFESNIIFNNNDVIVEENGYIETLTDLSECCFTSGQDILLQWQFLYNNTDLRSVDIVYSEEGSDDLIVLEDNVDNHNCFHLSFPDEFVDSNVNIDIIVETPEDAVVVTQPKIKMYVDPINNIINSNTCIVIDKGFILTDKPYINAFLDFYDSKNKLHEIEFQINLLNNAIDESNPVNIKSVVYDADNIKYKKIKLFVRDHNNKNIIAAFQQEDSYIYIF